MVMFWFLSFALSKLLAPSASCQYCTVECISGADSGRPAVMGPTILHKSIVGAICVPFPVFGLIEKASGADHQVNTIQFAGWS
jgi:hypothetical protein